MGSNLRRQLRAALPPSIKGLQRAVALEIADDARYDDDWNYSPETGRRSRVRLAELVRWTAAKDELSIREMLRRLSLAGWEFRLPIGKDKNGNLLYAVPGKAMTFRVPDFEGPTTVGPEVETEVVADPSGPTTVGPEGTQGPTVSGQGPTVVAEGPTVVGPGPTTVGPGPTTVGPPSPVSSFSTKESPSSSPVAEDPSEGSVDDSDGTDGGGGGNLSLEEITEQARRTGAFIDSLDFRGKAPGKKQRQQLGQRVTAAFKAGWSENGLRRYLDISDDPNVRSAAALYLHRLGEDELPDAGPETSLPPIGPDCYHDPAAATDVTKRVDPITGAPCPDCHPAARVLPPACDLCLRINPGAATDVSLRRNSMSFQNEPCPDCHPASVGQNPKVPPACQACLDENPAAEFNIKWRFRVIDDAQQACPDCHPTRIAFLATQRRDTADGGMWERAAARAAQRNGGTGARADSHPAETYTSSSVDDLFAPRRDALPPGLLPGDRRVHGWLQLADDIGRQEQARGPRPGPKPMVSKGRTPYQNPEDQSVYDEPLPGARYVVDQSGYDEDL